MREIFRAFANDMELQENSIIVSDRLDGVFDVELRNHFTHAYCTAGEYEMSYNGEGIRVANGDSQIAPYRNGSHRPALPVSRRPRRA